MRKADPRSLAVSIGDPSGAGPEVALAAWRLRKELVHCEPSASTPSSRCRPGQGIARPHSLIAALGLARFTAGNEAASDEP